MSAFIIAFQIALIVMFITTLVLLSATKSYKKPVLIASKIMFVITFLMTFIEAYYAFEVYYPDEKTFPFWFKLEFYVVIAVGFIFYIPAIIDLFTFLRLWMNTNFTINDIEIVVKKDNSFGYKLKYTSDKDIKAIVYSASTKLFKSLHLTPKQKEIVGITQNRGRKGDGIYDAILGLMFDEKYSLLEYDFDLWCYCARRYYQNGNSDVNKIIIRHETDHYFYDYKVFKYIYFNDLVSVDNCAIEIAEGKR